MHANDRKKFLEIVVGFAELRGRKLSAAALQLFWNSLQHWELAEFQEAAEHLVRSCQYMPTPADFEALRKAGRPTAGEAWITARRAAGTANCGGVLNDASASSGDALIDRVVRAIGGYSLLYTTETEKLPFLERRFCEHYATMQESQDVRDSIPEIADSDPNRLPFHMKKLTNSKRLT